MWTSVLLLIGAFFVKLWNLFPHSTQSVVVDLGYASYEGVYDAKNTLFLGALRWREPKDPFAVEGIQRAVVAPPSCYQGLLGSALKNPVVKSSNEDFWQPSLNIDATEDCLYLSVSSPGRLQPSAEPDKLLPVVVWIHGGGYAFGSSAGYNGEDIVRASGDGVVVVIIQYRLGLFGFLAGQKVKEDGALNVGLLDQQFALKWVQKHVCTRAPSDVRMAERRFQINKFGGDPKRVTIWGQSAGGGSVLQHVIANNGQTSPPLFKAAIASSTYLPSQYIYNDSVPEFWYRQVVERAKCGSVEDTLDCLRKTESQTLQTANADIGLRTFYGTLPFVPVRPTTALKEGKVNGKALLVTTVSDEGSAFVSEHTTSLSDYIRNLFPNLSKHHIATAVKLYANMGDAFIQASAVMSESIFVCPSYFLLDAFRSRSYKSEFAIPPAKHGHDLQYIFPTSALS
ncbi:Alpha/Beta hydrolase protein [Mucidula mucida]|nr:Alpha/Beta hydrolase protein [Mucidula mucida]